MKYILAISLIGFCLQVSSQNNENDTIIKYDYYPDKSVMIKEVFINKSNNPEEKELIYFNRKIYRKNGSMKVQSFFKNGLCVREIKYDKKERKKYEYLFDHENNSLVQSTKLADLYSKKYKTLWYNKGKFFMLETRVNDKKNGPTEIYDKDGIIIKIINFKDGKRISTVKP